ncbi:MAG: hypothetical protein LLF76_10010 [Planctomycetaceae bacterium]|nr:hypothetical protein [Planctomycetaceae bacterium]
MANYYNMQEVMEKLRKTEQEVQGLVKKGELRQYLDSGKPVFKVEDVDNLSQEIVGLDISSAGISLEEGTELDLKLEETGEIKLEPDESSGIAKAKADDLEIDESSTPPSEGGFGLSQMGDLNMADTNVGTVGINILSGTDDAYKLTEDSKAETKADNDVPELQMEEAPAAEEIESLDADSNLESFGSGSGLLDLSLQADDTSLGAVLDDILPSAAEVGAAAEAETPGEQGIGLMDEDNLVGSEQPQPVSALTPEPLTQTVAGPVLMPAGAQMVAVAPIDPRTNIYGVAMFLPMLALVLAAIVMASAIQGVVPSILKPLMEMKIADIGAIWYFVGGLIVLLLLMLLFSAFMGRESSAPAVAKVKKEKAPKKEKPKKKGK